MLYAALLILSALQNPPAEATSSQDTSIDPLQRVVTIVGSEEIKFLDIRAEVNRLVPLNFYHAKLPEEERVATYRKALKNLVEKSLIYQDAVARGLQITEEDIRTEFRAALDKAGPQYAEISDQEFDELLEEYRPRVARRVLIDRNEERFEASIPVVTEEAMKERFEATRDMWVTPEEARFRHIMVRVEPSASTQEKDSIRQQVEALQKRLLDGEDFAAAAEKYSDDIYATVGGDMGFIVKGAFRLRDVDASAFELQDGEISDVIKSLYGFHIVLRVETNPARPLTFEEAKADLREVLEVETRMVAREAWLESMRNSLGVKELITLEDETLTHKEEASVTAE